STTRAPACAAPSAAPSPAGPPPTTSTSVSAATIARRGGSSTRAASSGRFSDGKRLALVQHLERDVHGLARALLQRGQRLVDGGAQRAPLVPRAVEVRAQAPRVHEIERRCRQLQVLEEA